MTLPEEVRELLAWDKAIGERCNGLPVDEQRTVIHEALEERAAHSGLVVESVAQVQDFAFPPADEAIRLRVYRPFGDGYGLDLENIEAFTADYLAGPDDRETPYASPLCASDLAGLAPAHILTAEFDPLRDSGEAYARRLQEAGVKTTLHRFKGQTHGTSSLWQSWPPARAWMDEVVAAIRDAVFAPVSVA